MFKLQIYFVSIILLVFPPSITHGQQTISYGDYSIETKFSANDSRPYFTIKRGRHLLSKHSGLIASDIGMKIELVDLLNAQSKQLLLRMYTGGNHCCDIIRIYDLGPRLRLLFRSSDYDLNDREGLRYFEVKQLDNDAPLELVLRRAVAAKQADRRVVRANQGRRADGLAAVDGSLVELHPLGANRRIGTDRIVVGSSHRYACTFKSQTVELLAPSSVVQV